MFLKQIFAREAKLRGKKGNFKNFQGATIRLIVQGQKHSITFLFFIFTTKYK